jgi:Diol dehydratase reactivase ATPase-like domain/DD-reactivating factor swiveling domain
VRVTAGIDIGNSTTEVVLGHLTSGRVEVVASGRTLTRRAKGSVESLDGAVALVRRLERSSGAQVTTATAAPLRPVDTSIASLPEAEEDTGRLWIAAAGVGTVGSVGFGVGRPVRLSAALDGADRLAVVVPRGTRFSAAAAELGPLLAEGRLAAVLVEDDEAVLIANRLGSAIPVVDEVNAATVLSADLVAVEVSESSRPLTVLPDPLRLAAALALKDAEVDDAARLAPRLLDVSNAVVALGGGPDAAAPASGGWIEVRGAGRLPFLLGHDRVVTGQVGLASAYSLPPLDTPCTVDDLWTVDLAAVAAAVQARRSSTSSRPVSLAALRRDAPLVDPGPALAERLGVPVDGVTSEAAAARCGGLSTPAADAGTVVVDLGGGTIDVVSDTCSVVAAGGGELLTASVSRLAGMTGAAAEWVKRGPAYRVEAPQVLLAEDGSRRFLDRPAAPETVGSLVVHGPAGLLPFSRLMAPGEWRALRLRLKVNLVGGNVARALRTIDVSPRTVVIVGGPAGDDEVLAAVGGALPAGTAVGRGNVAGLLEHRYAVAYGLLMLSTRSAEPVAGLTG